MAETLAPRIRSLYRAILRELPRRPLSNPSPLQLHIRKYFSADAGQQLEGDGNALIKRVQEAEQFVQYARAQRMYATLLERYNPGMEMDQEERVRLTARRVGLNLPIEHQNGQKEE